MTVAEDQVAGGAHVLDVCVALTERQDEDEQMRQVVKRISLTQPAPIQIDSTEPDVIETALQQIPGRAIVNSVNLEAGRDKLDRVVPLAKAHGAALIALTIDEVGMAKTAERKLEIAQRITQLCCDEHGLDPEVLIFDCLTFTLTTGDEEWRPSAVETIEGIRRIKAEIPGVKTSLGVSNVSFGVGLPARSVLNSVFLHHCVEAGLDLAMVNPNHITPYGEIPEDERELADDLVFNRREDALERFIAHFESKGPAEAEEKADPTAGMEPEEALHFHILRRKKEGVEDWIDRSVEKIGAVPTLNDVLLPAMKEVGDKFGAGELILPFVLQSAEVMKRAVAQLEQLPRQARGLHEGHGRARDGVRRRARHRQVARQHDPHQQRLHGRRPRQAGADLDDPRRRGRAQGDRDRAERAARLDLQADAGVRAGAPLARARVPAADRRRGDQPQLRPADPVPERHRVRRGLRAGRVLLQGRVRGPREDGPAGRRRGARGADRQDARGREAAARAARADRRRRAARHRRVGPQRGRRPSTPIPTPPFWGVREIDVPMDEVYHHLDTHVLFKLHWGGRGVKGEEWKRLVREDFKPRLERMWREQTYLHPRALLGYFPCNSDGNELIVWDPEDFDPAHPRELERLVFPRQPRHDRICLADFYRPLGSGEIDVVALQAVTAGDEVTELMAKLEADGEFAEQLFVHGLGVQTAEGMAEWLHARVRADLGIEPTQGRRYSWGYPACPEQSEHEKVFALLDAPSIGLRLSGGYAVEPEQSTLAIVAHHPAGRVLRDEVRLPAEDRAGRRPTS